MQSTAVNDFTPATSLLQVGSYFDIVDNAVKTGDTNKRYTLSTNSCTAPSPPIKNGSFTSVVISPTADNMCDLFNSFIEAELQIWIKAPLKFEAISGMGHSVTTGSGDSAVTVTYAEIDLPHKRAVWIGYKDSMDSIESYSIVVNGQSIYTQNYAIEESYITACAATDAVKRTDIYSKACHQDIWKHVDTCKTGFRDEVPVAGLAVKETSWNTDTGANDPYKITLKIDLRRFLPLASIKYLPKFVGNFELRIKFSPAGLV
jgi:hypothetical protein